MIRAFTSYCCYNNSGPISNVVYYFIRDFLLEIDGIIPMNTHYGDKIGISAARMVSAPLE